MRLRLGLRGRVLASESDLFQNLRGYAAMRLLNLRQEKLVSPPPKMGGVQGPAGLALFAPCQPKFVHF